MKQRLKKLPMFMKRYAVRHPKPVYVVGGVLLAVIVAQFAYPSSRVLPFVRLNGTRVGAQSEKQITQMLIDTYSNVPLTLHVDGPAKDQSRKTTIAPAGLEPDIDRTLRELKAYPWWQRVIPFSGLVKGMTKNQSVPVTFDEQRFKEYANSELAACRVEPKNAGVTVRSGSVVLDAAKDGQACTQEALRKELKRLSLESKGVDAYVEADTIKPVRSDKDVATKLKEAQVLTERKLSLQLIDTEYRVEKATIAAWLVISEDTKDKKKLTVDFDTKPIRDYLTEMQKKIYITPGITTVRTADGVETGRSEGTSGRGLNFTTTADALKKQLLGGDGVVSAEIITLQPRVAYQRTYSATRAGLQALVNDIAKDKGDYAITVRLSDGSAVSANGTKRYHPASTYKMYVAYSFLKRIENGSIKWDDAATAGKNMSQCFDMMIINSDNTCAEWLGDKIGWANIQHEVRALGLSNTSTIRGAMYSTTDDETLFLHKLQYGNILGDAERARLLDVMKRQVYRQGIPAGTMVTVADKVGFIDGKLHDAAIVYGSKTYMLTIMSQGSTWAQIADAARQINEQLNRM
ncbi:serine hydrolase [Candidatus Saccharibacteria bacterium]|nr:MAG: serine hydrolase [Candidatus Saccharibacteria bacterium]